MIIISIHPTVNLELIPNHQLAKQLAHKPTTIFMGFSNVNHQKNKIVRG